MNVGEYLAYAGELRQMSKAEVKKRLPEVLQITDLEEVSRDQIGTLSHGYRQRVGVGQAIIHQPKFLILDEPTRGLDPVQIVEMRNLIHDLKQNHTVLISSHILTEISQTCDRLLVLGKGQVLAVGTESELSGRKDDIQQITVLVRSGKAGDPYRGDAKDESGESKDKKPDEPRDQIKKLLTGIEGVQSAAELYSNADGMAFTLTTSKDCRAEVSRAIVEAKLELLQLDFARSELESTFIRLVGGSNAGN